MKKRHITTLLAVMCVAMLTWALPALAATTVNVTAGKPSEFRFTLSTKSVKAGKVTFKVTNKGKIKHDFSIAGKKTKMLSAGQSTTLTVTLKKGSVAYKCTVSGHAAAGMKGTIKVT
jgi:uncharacterized cupredoxin-like copper-binding protein